MLRSRAQSPGALPTYLENQPGWLWPVLIVEWPVAWLAYILGHWSVVKVFDYLGKFSVLIAVVFYFTESPNRIKQKHYQAWQVINTAQHMGGSGGRIDALSELNADGVPLVGVDVSSAFLQGVQLPKARLLRANFDNADVRSSDLAGADLTYASLRGANFRQSSLTGTVLNSADFTNADLCSAQLRDADLDDAILDGADLGNADLADIKWQHLKSIRKANIAGIRNAPEGFVSWALKNGAVRAIGNASCPAPSAAR
jgi:hypothetical protein